MSRRGSFVLWLKESAYNAILVETIKQMPFETGGVLIGYWGNEWEAVVTEVIGPGPKAIYKKYSFVPDHKYHEREIEKAYVKTEGRKPT
jgi:integrative and conjugative element protein (TIGR02256 family)